MFIKNGPHFQALHNPSVHQSVCFPESFKIILNKPSLAQFIIIWVDTSILIVVGPEAEKKQTWDVLKSIFSLYYPLGYQIFNTYKLQNQDLNIEHCNVMTQNNSICRK